LFQESIRGLKRNSTYALVGVISSGVQILCNILFIIGLGMRSTALLISPAIAYTISLLFVLVFTRFYQYISMSEIKKDTMKVMLKYSIPLVPDAICWWLLLGFGRVFLSQSHGVAAVGIYAVANKFPSILTMFYSIFNLAWQENAYSQYGTADRDFYYSKMYNALMKLIFCALIVALPATKIIAPRMLGVAFKTAYLYIPVLYVSALLSMLSTFYGSCFESAKKTNGILISTLVAVIINVGFSLLLTPKWGIFGVALSMPFSYMGLFVMRVIRSKQFFSITVEKQNATILSAITLVWLGLYYIDSLIVQIFALLMGCIIFLYINKSIVRSVFTKFRKGSELNAA
jgi:O-antigen/teichoic acid export membrane protein